jgi:AcrR family transcriptional regulator
MTSTDKRELKKEKIINIATKMLEQKNYNEIRIEDIAKEARMTKSTFFYYFESKASLYLEILYRMNEEVVKSFISLLEKEPINNLEDFKNYIMKTTDDYITNHSNLIKLLEYEELINSEGKRQQVVEIKNKIRTLYDGFYDKILASISFFDRTEIFYVFEVQLHFLRGYYRQMISNVKYYVGERHDLEYERKSLYEFRVVRMLRYFIAGIIFEKRVEE